MSKQLELFRTVIEHDRIRSSGQVELKGEWIEFQVDVVTYNSGSPYVSFVLGDILLDVSGEVLTIKRHVKVAGHDDFDEYPVLYSCPVDDLVRQRPQPDETTTV